MNEGPAANSLISHYRIISKLGEGGMGEIFLAEDTRLKRNVALKILTRSFAANMDRVRRFEQEAYAASALNHPNILTIYERGEEGEIGFIVSELVDGEALRARIDRSPVAVKEAVGVAIQIASGLDAAHRAGIIHRDIKPENIMIRRDGIVKVLDFGLAKLAEVSPASIDTEAPTRAIYKTDPAKIMGTAVYMSPEQARGLTIDARTDIFSLGVVIYEMIAGHRPFAGSNSNEILASILSDKEPPPLARYANDVPAELERIVAHALRKDPDRRYQNVRDLLLDLTSLQERMAFESELKRSASAEYSNEAPSVQFGNRVGYHLENGTQSTRSDSNIEDLLVGFKRRKGTAFLVLAALVAATVLGWFYFLGSDNTAATNQPISIAILPFADSSADADTEYLSDGITDSIISSLSQLSQLRVMARSTVFRYKGKEIDPKKVGAELGVQAVLMGRVIQRNESLTITTELVSVSDGTQLWGGRYNRKLADVFAVQEEIAQEISEKLRLRLTGDEKKLLAKRYTDSTDAYQLYLMGRFHWAKFTKEEVEKSIEYYNQALAKDSNYALAYFGLSDAYALLATNYRRPNEAFPKALFYAEKALELDPTLLEAHFARGAYELWYGWDWRIAEQELKRAMDPNTNTGGAHDLYGQFLVATGRFDEGLAESKRGVELQPFLPITNANLALNYYLTRQYNEAISQCRKTLELDPAFFPGSIEIGWTYGQQGRYQDALAELTRTRDMPGGFVPATAELGYVYAVSGERAGAQKMLQELHERSGQEFVDPYYIAIIHLGLGDADQTFLWLNKAYEERSFWLLYLRVEPKYDRLRQDPRFADLVRRVGLPQ